MYWKTPSLKYSVKKATDILISYGTFFLPFLLIALALGTYRLNLENVLLEAIAVRRDIMYFCWYVPFYCLTVFLLPIVARLLTDSPLVDISIVLIMQVVLAICSKIVLNAYLSDLLEGLYAWFPSVLIGYIAAKYALLDKIEEGIIGRPNKWMSVPIYLALLMVPFMRRAVTFELVFVDYFRQPVSEFVNELIFIFFIYGLFNILWVIKQTRFHRILERIGEVSLEMWFVHGIFFNTSKEYKQGILYAPKSPIFVFVWGCLLCYGMAKLVESIIKTLTKKKNTLLRLEL